MRLYCCTREARVLTTHHQVAFVSHQWCGWDHPDRYFQQLGPLKTALERMR